MNKLQNTLAVQAATMFLCLLFVGNADAEIRTITATGEYRMGDNDTRTDAKRLALLDAKRLALEQSGTYIESITEVKNFDLTKEEIRAYTAGIVEVVEQATKDIMEGSTHIIRVEVTARIDTDVVTRQVDALRKNESGKKELLRFRAETDQLKQEIDAKTRELAALKSKTEVETVTKQRQQAVTRLKVNELLEQAWLAWMTRFGEGGARVRRLVEQVLALDPFHPDGRHLMGLVLSHERHHEAAVREFEIAISLTPNRPLLHEDFGMALEEMGNLPRATAEYRDAVRLAPDCFSCLEVLGDALLKMGDRKSAISVLRAMLREDPEYPDPHYALAVALMEEGHKQAAASEFGNFLRLVPNNPALYGERIKSARTWLKELER